MKRCFSWWLALLLWQGFAAEQDPRMVPPRDAITGKLPSILPLAAREAAKTFRVLDGFQMDLLAAEPSVASPVAIAYDENGRAYVCEMRDYPYTDKARHRRNQENPTDVAIGSVRWLEDTDGDGVFDKSMVFAEGLSWPTGVACWKGGVFVAATPDIWYFKDTDGDGKADLRRKIFTGFRKLNVQSVMNTLVWGLDNRIYGSGSSNGGDIRSVDKPDAKPLVMGRNDFRFDPVTEEFELLSGGARFGGTFDDWGHRFLCDIRNPAQQVMLPRHYLARNPFLAAGSTLNDMAEAGDQLPVYRVSRPEPWRALRAQRWAGERDIVMPRSELVGAGVVTSSSGVTCYRGAAYPAKYYGNVFVAECAGNLFYRLGLTPDGPTFKATRVDGQAEIVASTDNWFRPVNFVNAPDGTLHVVDMYRENIEHPWSIPDDIHAAVDLESGRDRGRIWRLAPPNFKPPEPPRLGRASTSELVGTLENPNAWWRETAQRLLFERQDKSAVAPLRKIAKESGSAQARVHALWTLAGLNALTDDDLLTGLADKVSGVRENAIKLAEPRIRLETRETPSSVSKDLFSLVDHPHASVRMQLAFTLGETRHPSSLDALANLVFRDGRNPWIRQAILSSVADRSAELIVCLLTDARPAEISEVLYDLGRIVGARGKTDEINRVVLAAGRGREDYSGYLRHFKRIVSGIGEALKRSGQNLSTVMWDAGNREAIERLFSVAALVVSDSGADSDARAEAVRLLALGDLQRVKSIPPAVFAPVQPHEVQSAAIAALASFSDPSIGPLLLSYWRNATPATRSEIVLAMLSNRSRTVSLLEAINDGLIPANQVPFARRAALVRSTDPSVRNLASRIFSAPAASRDEVVARYQAALSLRGDAALGRKIFETACATCHRAGEIGKEVGPNLAAIRQWNREQILINILDPNREVASNFLAYTVETRDGRTVEGVIYEETAANFTLKRADGGSETVLRRDVIEISGSGLSLMPEGLENSVTVEQMADLIAFLKASP